MLLAKAEMVLYEKKETYSEKVFGSMEWCHWFVLFNVFISVLIGIRYPLNTISHFTTISFFYNVAALFGHFWFLIFAAMLIVPFPLAFIVTNRKWYIYISTAAAIIGQSILLVDTQIYHYFRFHLNEQIIEMLFGHDNLNSGVKFYFLMVVIPIIVVTEIILAKYAIHKQTRHTFNWITKAIVTLYIGSFVIMHLMHIWADHVQYEPILAHDGTYPLSSNSTANTFLNNNQWLPLPQAGNYRQVDELSYPLSPIKVDGVKSKRFNYVIVSVKGFSPSYISADITPTISEIASKSSRFGQHYSNSISAESARFSLFYGLVPQYEKAARNDMEKPELLEELQRQGYKIKVILSGDEQKQQPLAFNGLRNQSIAFALNDRAATADAESFIQKTFGQSDEPAFIYLELDNPRLLERDGINKFKPVIDDTRIITNGGFKNSDAKMEALANTYKNSVLSVDNNVRSLLNAIEESDSQDNTVIIIMGLTGTDCCSESSKFSHDGAYTYKTLSVPLIIKHPGNQEPAVTDKLTSHVDIAATIMWHDLGVITDIGEFSNGNDLYSADHTEFVICGNERMLCIVNTNHVTQFLPNGSYTITDRADQNSKTNNRVTMRELARTARQLIKFHAE